MRTLCLALIVTLLASAPTGASPSSSRGEALTRLLMLRDEPPPVHLAGEFRSIEDAFANGEKLAATGAETDAEACYRLMLLKAELYENSKRAAVEPAQPPASSSPLPEGPPLPQPEAIRAADRPAPGAVQPAPPPGRQTVAVTVATPGPEPGKASLSEHDRIVGGETVYIVTRPDTLRHISAKLGVSVRYLARKNKLDPNKTLVKGQKIRVCTRRIIPKKVQNGLVINIPDRTLYHFSNGAIAAVTPVSVGRPRQKDRRGWETPLGTFRIVAKMKSPSWRVPLSIQNEMAEQGKSVEKEVAAGPANPLGKYAMRTSIAGILIHGTNMPASIYGFTSHGCIRVYPEHMEALYRDVKVDTPGEIIYQPVKVVRTAKGRIYLEVHDDAYNRLKDLKQEVHDMIRKNGLDALVDWQKVGVVVKDRSGIAEEINL